ncbi:hypothetical protein [Halolamina salifodinae]|uniref:DUF7988 domain-containing protein n=1 Tax=Halolamina salifodinae TaxID=1202767 RepID=A0A8T4GS68_9EURY|nr:hypothetical protein [Halolamina salifodinae]MBP1985686.1 hypothetical protein [Halolamina salifodinae]
MPADRAAAAREQLLAAHESTIDATLAAADAVAADWPRLDDGRPATTDRDALVAPLRAELEDRGVLGTYPRVLADAVEAAGDRLPARPVPAPPYVVLTSTGPVLRGTVDDGRYVIRIDCFEIVREPDGVDAAVAIALTASSADAALSVAFEQP